MNSNIRFMIMLSASINALSLYNCITDGCNSLEWTLNSLYWIFPLLTLVSHWKKVNQILILSSIWLTIFIL